MTAFVLATGPSLTQSDVDKIRHRGTVYVVKEAHRFAPWADHLYCADFDWFDYYKGLPDFTGRKWVCCPNSAKKWGLEYIPARNELPWSLDASHIATGGNSGFQAINIAENHGHNVIILLGFDMQPVENRRNFYTGLDNRQKRPSNYADFVQAFTKAKKHMKARVINTCMDSAITSIEKMPLDEVLDLFCPDELTSPKIAAALQASLPSAQITTTRRDGGWLGFGSPSHYESLLQCQDNCYDWYYVDHAYFGRMKYYRITRNAYQHNGYGDSCGSRLRNLGVEYKKRAQGGAIIIALQSDMHYVMRGTTREQWLRDTVRDIRKYTDRRIIYTNKRGKTLAQVIDRAWCVVTHSSNAAIDAIMNGLPCVTTHQCAASLLSTQMENIESPRIPCYENAMALASVLADNQFTLDEIAGGMWKRIIC